MGSANSTGRRQQPVPGKEAAGERLCAITVLCNNVPHNKSTARHIANRCEQLCNALKQYEKKLLFKRKGQYQTDVLECLAFVKDKMQDFSEGSWLYLLVHPDEVEAGFRTCDTKISECLAIFIAVAKKKQPIHSEEGEAWRRDLEGHLEEDHITVLKELSAPNIPQLVTQSLLAENDQRTILVMMQRGLAKRSVLSDEEHRRLAKNLYVLLRLSNQVPPECRLDSGEVAYDVHAISNEDVDMYKGRFLYSQDVRIKVIRSPIKDHRESIRMIRREVELWAKIYKTDQRKQIIPFYGFHSLNGHRLALVSPWTDRGNVLVYVKKHDKHINYREVILGIADGIQVLHSMNPPIIHANLRAENVLIGNKGEPLITDFGVAKLEGNLTAQSTDTSDSCRWLAPEMFEERVTVSAKSDVYSFGMTILELFTHQMPYIDISKSIRVIYKKLNGEVPERPQDKRAAARGLDDNMWQLLRLCWSKNPNHRASISDLIRRLRYPSSPKGDEVEENKMTQETRQSLLAMLKSELSKKGMTIDLVILDLVHQLLNLPDYGSIVTEVKDASDAELYINFMLYLLRDGDLSDSGIEDANRKARKLMFELISKIDVMPRLLRITDLRTVDVIDMGDSESRSTGAHKGRSVSLKVIDRAHHRDTSLRKELYREILGWRSLKHHRILPLLGVFQEPTQLSVVSPPITNGSLTEWRKKQEPVPDVAEIQRIMREVAEGVRYIHSQGIVHSDLRGENIFLNHAFHCQIADVGFTRSSDASTLLAFRFAAPELYGEKFDNCGRPGCDGCHDVRDMQRRKTMQADVYAFGCIYYAIYFDTVPFEGLERCQLTRLVNGNVRPTRKNKPKMDDIIWNLVQLCWMHNPSDRPTMELIAEYNMAPSALRLLLATLSELTTLKRKTVNEKTLRLISEVLDMSEDTIALELRAASNLELLLDFVLYLLGKDGPNNLGIHDLKRRFRMLMSMLISVIATIPRSLSVINIEDIGRTTIGGLDHVFKGEYKRQPVALKALSDISHEGDSLRKDFWREALVWKSLSHRFILPLLGIYEDQSHIIYLVSPLMENGTLSHWRKSRNPAPAKMHRAMLDVAEGIKYMHSEGIVHGDLHGGNVLLDSDFRCQITDFGLTAYFGTSVGQSTDACLSNCAPPEQFMCTKCGRTGCDGYCEGNDARYKSKTTKTDVYAFGCLYYTIFFDTLPFQEKNGVQIMQLVTSGQRPERLNTPSMDDDAWNLIQRCWEYNPSDRPTMEEIVQILARYT